MISSLRKMFIVSLLTAAASKAMLAQGATVDVTVIPQSDGKTIPSRSGFLVCIGTSSDADQYGTETTTSTGIANQNFRNLPVNTTVRVTVTKSGYTGTVLTATLREGSNNHLQAQMVPGSGGPTCPAASSTLQLDGRVVVPIASRPATTSTATTTSSIDDRPSASWQDLAYHGRVFTDNSRYVKLDCVGFGPGFVMTGISGRSGLAVDQIKVHCTKLNSAGGIPTSNGTVRTTGSYGGTGGTAFSRQCPAGQAVIGIRGYLGGYQNQLRALGIQCRALSNATATGSTSVTTIVGSTDGATAFPQDNCAEGRPGMWLKVSKDSYLLEVPVNVYVAPAPDIIAGVQLRCEFPPEWSY